MENHQAPPSYDTSTKPPQYARSQNPAILNRDRDSGFKGIFGTTGNGCFIATDIIISVLLFAICLYTTTLRRNGLFGLEHWVIIILAICSFAPLGLETFGTIKKNRIAMIAGLVLTVILFGLFVFISDLRHIPFVLLAVWNLFRFIFQIKVIQWIHDNRNIPLLPQTSNGYQKI